MLRILMVNDYLPTVIGGAESHLNTLAHAIERVAGRSNEEVDICFVAAFGVEPMTLRAAIDEHKPDIIHCHNMAGRMQELGMLIQAKVPVVLSLHDYWPFCPGRMLAWRGIMCSVCDDRCKQQWQLAEVKAVIASDRIAKITFNPRSSAIFDSQGIHNVMVIPHGIDLDKVREATQPEYEARDYFVFGVAHKHYWWKGESILDRISRGYPIVKAINVPQPRFHSLLRKSLAFLNPSYYQETFSLVTIEAMASGVPPICFAVAGPSSIVNDGVDGFVVPYGDEVAFKEKMDLLMKDHSLSNKMGVTARKSAEEKFNSDRMAADYIALYRDLMARRL